MSCTRAQVHTARRAVPTGKTGRARQNVDRRIRIAPMRVQTKDCMTAVITVCIVAGCTPTMHTVEPYTDDAVEAAALEARAAARCEARRGPKSRVPSKTFITDGCSLWIDRSWDDCSVEHDIEYWCGGSITDRKAADAALRRCFAEFLPGWFTWGPCAGVRIGGHPAFSVHYRWGFGRDSYLPWYDPGAGVAATDRTGPGARGAPGPARRTHAGATGDGDR